MKNYRKADEKDSKDKMRLLNVDLNPFRSRIGQRKNIL